MSIPLRVLIVEDSADDAELLLQELRQADYDPIFERVQTAEAMKAALDRGAWDLVVSDYSMPQFDAPTALKLLRQSGRDLPFIVVSGNIGEETAVAMMRAGAHDYILKGNLIRFVPALQRELREAEIRRQQTLIEQAKQRLQGERDELLERLKQENEDLAALTRVSANAISTLDLDELLRGLLGRVAEVMRADAATIVLMEGGELRVQASVGAMDWTVGQREVRVGEGFAGVIGVIAARLKPVYVEDARRDPLLQDPQLQDRGVRSLLGVPLKCNGMLVGVLHVDWLTVRPGGAREVNLLEIMAEQCAAAILNAQAYQEAKRSAATLAESEAHLQQFARVIEQTADAVLITDRDGLVQYVNPAFEESTGYGAAEVIGRKPNILKSGQHTPEFYEHLWRTIAGGEPFRATFANRDKQGALFYEEKTITPIKDDRGDITHFVSTAKDVTHERIKAQELRESEERFRQLAENVSEVFWMTDPAKNQMIYISPAYETISGRTCASLYASPRDWLEAIFPEDRERIVQAALAKQTAGTYDEEYRVVRPDGTIRWIRDRAFPVHNEDGQVYRIAGVASDITERKWSERRNASEQRVLELLASGGPLPQCLALLARECEDLLPGTLCSVMLLDESGRRLRLGAAPSLPPDFVAAIDGIEVGRCLGSGGMAAHSGRAVIVSDIATDPLWAGCKELALSHGLRTCYSVLIMGAADKVLGTFALYCREPRRPQPEERATHERAAYLAGLAILRHQTMAALRESEERHRLLFEGVPLPMCVYDLETLRILAVNEVGIRHYGYTREDLSGLTIEQLFSTDDLPALRKFLTEFGSESMTVCEWRHRRKNGTIFPVEVLGRSLQFNGRAARLVLATDVTEKKLLHEKFLHAQRLESLGMLASGIAHDLNNILAPILFVGPLLRQGQRSSSELKIITTLERSAERGASLVRQILAFSHGSTGEPRLTQVRHIVREVASMVEETFPKSIRLEHSIPSDLWPAVVNPTQIHQVLLNLCVNARDAMPQGGSLHISAANRRLNHAEAEAIPGARPGLWLVLKVADTGSGISAEVLGHIWEPFFTTKAPGKGTGLGLSTVRGIVTDHLGFIQLETAANEGTTFHVFLPATLSDLPEGGSAAPTNLPSGSGEFILIVDDDQAIREVADTILSRHGYRVATCADGVEAVTRFSEHPGKVALVLTDVDMPNLGGALLARVLLQLRPDVRLIAMSGLSGGGTLGADIQTTKQLTHAFLLKPFLPEDLLWAVHRTLHPKRPAEDLLPGIGEVG